MPMEYHSVILLYTFVDNEELDSEFLSLLKNEYGECIRLNESTYALKSIDYLEIAEKVKDIYKKAIKKYPSRGEDYISLLYAAELADENNRERFDRIVENRII